jgi:heme exporter protein C
MMKRAVWLPAASTVLLPVAVALVFFYAPEERTMGLVQKIFYFHLSLAGAAFLSFLVACGAGVAYIMKRERRWDALGAASVEVGVLFTSLVLVTGSLWGRPIWNTWWTWDPRLTTSLILWFIYASCLILRSSVDEEVKRATYTAVMAIVGFVDVPIVFLSARLFRSIHPTVLRSDSVGLEPAMVMTLLVSLAAVLLLWAGLVRLRCALFMQEAVLKDLQTQMEK